MNTVALFGSARPDPSTKIYQDVYEQSKLLTEGGWRVATGGGPGLMEAANKASKEHCHFDLCSLGYSIYLPFEATTNEHVEHDSHHQNFFTRLDQFCNDCDAFIANPGGIGTSLEILIVAQLKQVDLLHKPLILVGRRWKTIMNTLYDELLADGYISVSDRACWEYVETPQDAARLLLRETHKQ